MFRPAAGDVRARNARDTVALDGRDVTDAFARCRRGRKNPRAVRGDSPRIAERRPRLARRDNTCPAGATYGTDFQCSHYCRRIYRRMTPEDNSTRSTLTYPHGFGEKIMNVALAGYVGPACRKVKLHSGNKKSCSPEANEIPRVPEYILHFAVLYQCEKENSLSLSLPLSLSLSFFLEHIRHIYITYMILCITLLLSIYFFIHIYVYFFFHFFLLKNYFHGEFALLINVQYSLSLSLSLSLSHSLSLQSSINYNT
ncbi:hypothetical protein ALC56_05280 [Trachymyrmex septentrionalis]|uniref:Uncharacterized protein n=1 Tax=Trachymyrmex septentrionalis TaxID=34720 RepID=A0A195FI15_9HYME|nr:hypothetical protein ALC56_05280 [Trachymyrmex septentrionalis]